MRPDGSAIAMYHYEGEGFLSVVDAAEGWSLPVVITMGSAVNFGSMDITTHGNTIVWFSRGFIYSSSVDSAMVLIRPDNSVGPDIGGMPSGHIIFDVVVRSYGRVVEATVAPTSGSGSFTVAQLTPTGVTIPAGARLVPSGDVMALAWVDPLSSGEVCVARASAGKRGSAGRSAHTTSLLGAEL
ncbi:MAG: hypothetical protein ACJATT_005357 [Myxococcota bacterium]